jgi:hypothetical protein
LRKIKTYLIHANVVLFLFIDRRGYGDFTNFLATQQLKSRLKWLG